MRRLAFIGLLCAVTAAPLLARHDSAGCGTTPTTPAEVLFRHRQAERARAARLKPLAAAAVAPSTNRDAGNVAIIENTDGVVDALNQFDLDNATLTFTPVAGGTTLYRYAYSGLGYDAGAASQGSLVAGLGDDDARLFTLPFAFPFYGATYTTLFLDSDGNLTFTAAEFASTSRSLGRMTGGPPRIAPLFDDLDPSQPSGSVRFFADANHVVFSWVNVPEWEQYGLGAPQTFQARLYADGSIQFSYSGVDPTSAVVGIAPGYAQPGTSVVSFRNDASAEYPAAVAETFGSTPEIDIVTVAQKFYQTHEDAYDYLVIYNNMEIAAMTGAVAYETTVRSSGTGYSVAPADYGPQYGSAARLRSVMNMGMLDNYPLDVNAVVPLRAAAQDTPLTVLGHESGHLFLAYASIPDPTNPTAKPMIGYGGAHWSFVFNSEASLDEGEHIDDLGGGQFITGAVTQGFAPLDRYLMGFAPSTDVPDTFVVLNPSVSPLGHPMSGYFFVGQRLNIGVNDVIRAMGRRTPDYTVAQRRFRFAFILVVPEGAQDAVIAPNVQQVETYRQKFVAAYSNFSNNLGTADTTLNRSLRLSLFPAAGLVAGGSATATISLQTPPTSDLAVKLTVPSDGFAQVPPLVTIAAGATSASFTISGKNAGVEDLLATPADSSYEVAFARVQVAAPSQLTLLAVSGDNQVSTSAGPLPTPIVVRLTDVNGLAYPGAGIQAAAAGGAVTPAIATTDASGQASFQWTPGAGSANQLTLSLLGAPSVTLTLKAGSAVPVISSVVNAASYAAGVAPGSLATLFGVNLGGATVLLNGAAVQSSYAGDAQVNFYVPAQTPVGSGVIAVTAPSGVQVSSKINLVAAQPGIFSGAVVHADSGASALTVPVGAGDYIAIYCTGLGPTQTASNGLSVTTVTPAVYLGATAATPSYSGLAPGFPGLYQVDVRIPAGLPSGTLPVVITSSAAYSNAVNIAVQ
jgi:uncharacterized protein (TIGR03437 family)